MRAREMSFLVSQLVWGASNAKGNTRLVMLALADRSDDTGYSFPGLADIAKRTKISRRTIQNHLPVLRDKLQELRIKRTGRGNKYFIDVQKLRLRSEELAHQKRNKCGADVQQSSHQKCKQLRTNSQGTVSKPSINRGRRAEDLGWK